MNIKPIRTQDDHETALCEIERLWGSPPGTADGDRLDVLATLVDVYEATAFPVAAGSPIELLNFAITDMGRSQAELAKLLGSRSRASEILSGKRKLSVEQIAKISAAWHLPAALLVQPYKIKARSAAKRTRRRALTRRGGTKKAA